VKKLVLTLTILGLFSALALAFVFEWTSPLIKEHQEATKKEAILAVLPQSDDYKEVQKEDITFYEGNKGGEVAMIAQGGGFQGMIRLMIGTNPGEGKIYAIRILEHSETPGLGAFITGDKYRSNFKDKPFGDYKVVKRPAENPYEVEAISGATISSEKVTRIVEEAVKEIERVYGGGN
jgi:electron transport complex protein RnfG